MFSKNSDSFDDRFCDDLCEEILQYLPLNEKMRFECVSKQFQRTVFRRVHQFRLVEFETAFIFEGIYNFIPNTIWKLKYSSDELKMLMSFESLLKKCPNIDSIRYISQNSQNIKLMLQMFTKYCNNLSELNSNIYKSNDCNESQEFFRKFGPKLRDYYNNKFFHKVEEFNLFPNLRSLNLDTNGSHLDDILQLNLRRVKSLNLIIEHDKGYMVPKVLQKFNEIRHLTLDFKSYNEMTVFNALQDSPLLQNVIDLKVWAEGDQRSDFIINCLKQMAIKSPNLKRIELFNKKQFITLKNTSDFEQLMSSLKAFPNLKRLGIRLQFMSGLEFDEIFSFKGFPQELTHLRIDFYRQKLNVLFFEDIDIYLPKIQCLMNGNPMIIDEEGVTQMVGILSRVSKFATIFLSLETEIDCQYIQNKIIEKCLNLTRIQ